MGRLVFIHGAPAVGKLTVGKAILDKVPGRLFENHAAIDFARTLFEFGAPGFWELVQSARLAALTEAAAQGLPLIVMTFCYSEPEDRELFDQFEAVFLRAGGQVCPVSLHCSIEEANRRVGNPDRVQRRKTSTVKGLADFCARWIMSPVPRATCLKIDTGISTPDQSAAQIIRHFQLEDWLDPADA